MPYAVEWALQKARGHDDAKIERVWGFVTGFSGYAFCKAHSTAYGIEADQSAWLKKNFPAEFMAAVLSNGKGFYDPVVYVLETHRLGLKFLPPTVNDPGPAFTVQGNAIRVPLARAQGLSERTLKRLLAERKRGARTSPTSTHLRVPPRLGELEVLICAG